MVFLPNKVSPDGDILFSKGLGTDVLLRMEGADDGGHAEESNHGGNQLHAAEEFGTPEGESGHSLDVLNADKGDHEPDETADPSPYGHFGTGEAPADEDSHNSQPEIFRRAEVDRDESKQRGHE